MGLFTKDKKFQKLKKEIEQLVINMDKHYNKLSYNSKKTNGYIIKKYSKKIKEIIKKY